MQRAFDWRLKLWLKFGTHRKSFRHFWFQCTNNFGVLPMCSPALQCNNLRVILDVKYRAPQLVRPHAATQMAVHKRHAESQRISRISKRWLLAAASGRGEGRASTATQMINMSGVGSTIQNIMDEEMRSCHLLRESALLCADSLQPTVVQWNSGKWSRDGRVSALCSGQMFRRFGGTYCLHLHSDWIGSNAWLSNTKEENVSSPWRCLSYVASKSQHS